jgi:hypothetical protein
MIREETNSLVAEFMGEKRTGYDHYYIPRHGEWSSIPYSHESETKDIFTFEEMKYDKSWDWLKPVIDKIIKEIGVKTVDECTDEEWKVTTNVTRMWIGVSIEQAYHYVVEYILWHNKNK